MINKTILKLFLFVFLLAGGGRDEASLATYHTIKGS